jgi:hypothetical protein
MAIGARVLLVCVSVFVAGCGWNNHVAYNAEAAKSVKQRAAFDFSCPEKDITTSEVVKNEYGFVRNVGAEGCGKKAIYVDPSNRHAWVMNGVSDEAPKPKE